MSPFERRYARKEPPAACPLCKEPVPKPRYLTEERSPDACQGGRCSCGALYIVDVTGRAGGQAVLDGLAMLCDGDIDKAMQLRAGVDYVMEGVGYNPRTHSLDPKQSVRRYGLPKLWFFRLKNKE